MTALSTRKKALRMIRGRGAVAVTHYSCGVVRRAKRDGVKIVVMRKGKEVVIDARQVCRDDLKAVYGDTHELAGQGKFIALEAYPKGDTSHIVGAQHVNPYLRESGPYATIIEVLKNSIGMRVLSRLRGTFANGFSSGAHILWAGKRNGDGFLPGACSDWFTAEEIWDLACEANPDLLKNLRKSKSGRKGASHKSAQEKFVVDLDVLRRATRVIHVADGELEYCGGATPYSKPLEQCGFAIDKRFLTYGVDANGDEVGQYYYRLVVGRPEPHVLRRSDWQYEGISSVVAFKSDKAKQIVRKAS